MGGVLGTHGASKSARNCLLMMQFFVLRYIIYKAYDNIHNFIRVMSERELMAVEANCYGVATAPKQTYD